MISKNESKIAFVWGNGESRKKVNRMYDGFWEDLRMIGEFYGCNAIYRDHRMDHLVLVDPEMLKEFCNEYPGKLILGVDSLNGYVKTDGWIQSSKLKPEELIKKFENIKLAGLIYTDISRDGMMLGPNIEATLALANMTDIPVIASGGVSNLDHIKELSSSARIHGVICGRALYEEEFTLKEAMKVARR